MKITKTQLKQLIEEEISKVLSEQPWEVGHEPVTAEEEAARKEKAAEKHRAKAQRLRDLAQKETVPGDAGADFTKKGRELMAKADRHEEQAAIVDGQAAKLRSGEPGREERGYGRHLEEAIKEVIAEGWGSTDQGLFQADIARTRELQKAVRDEIEREEKLQHLDSQTLSLIAARAVSALRRIVPEMDI